MGGARTEGGYLQVSADRFSPHGDPPQDGVTVLATWDDGVEDGNQGHTMTAKDARRMADLLLDAADMAEGMCQKVNGMPPSLRWRELRGS